MNFDRRCDNRTPMEARCLAMEDRHGRSVLVTIAKMSYAVSPTGVCTVANPLTPIRLGDVRHGDSGWSSIRYPSDFVDDKPGTDVIFVGHAYPPQNRSVTELDVSVRVGLLSKTVRVYGQRVYHVTGFGTIAPGPPLPLGPTPLIYELAQGGHDLSGGVHPVVDLKNPVGIGVAADRTTLIGKMAHQIEVPSSLLAAKNTEPAGFGAISADWTPRVTFAGTHDLAWQRDRAPIRPKDFDVRHNAVSHPDLWSSTPLLGDEPVEIVGATPEGRWRFKLPLFTPRFETCLRGIVTEQPTHLDTFLIDGDERRVELTWRVSVLMPKKAEFLESVRIFPMQELPESVLNDLAERTLLREGDMTS